MNGARCCVIGGAGFIGRHLSNLLAASGHRVTVMGRSPRPSGLGEQICYEVGDYGDRSRLKDVLDGTTEVIDLAYATAPQTSFADPVFDVVANVPPSVVLLQECVAARVRKVVLVSSGGTVYGVPNRLPLSEDHPTRPISPYGITKLAVEHYGWMFRALADLPVVVVRPANAYGEGQRKFTGQGFIAAAMHRILAGQPVDIYGAQGTIRDYIHVTDVASGIAAALRCGSPGSAYNIGSGKGCSNVEVLKLIEPLAKAAGLEVNTRFLPGRKFDVPASCLDSARLRSISGWEPLVSLETGVAELWRALVGSRGRASNHDAAALLRDRVEPPARSSLRVDHLTAD